MSVYDHTREEIAERLTINGIANTPAHARQLADILQWDDHPVDKFVIAWIVRLHCKPLDLDTITEAMWLRACDYAAFEMLEMVLPHRGTA